MSQNSPIQPNGKGEISEDILDQLSGEEDIAIKEKYKVAERLGNVCGY